VLHGDEGVVLIGWGRYRPAVHADLRIFRLALGGRTFRPHEYFLRRSTGQPKTQRSTIDTARVWVFLRFDWEAPLGLDVGMAPGLGFVVRERSRDPPQ
jgi:hypothetical protein